MQFLDLFSGIGGFALGLERAGMQVAALCESDRFCKDVLRKHWPGVPCYDDVRTLDAARLSADGIAVDLICGGFPCQDISIRGDGIMGARSGLWADFARLIRTVRPRYVLVENVPAILSGRGGLGNILGDLAAERYDAEWHCIPAAAIGAPHRRDRFWLIAYTDSGRCGGIGQSEHQQIESTRGPVSYGRRKGRRWIGQDVLRDWSDQTLWWEAEPGVDRVADGIPARSHRLRALGNAVVPQIVEMFGREIMKWEGDGDNARAKGGELL